MDNNLVFHSWLDLPFALDEDCWGELDEAVEECPGVYYVRTVVEGEVLGRELYAVTTAACSRSRRRARFTAPPCIAPPCIARSIFPGISAGRSRPGKRPSA